MLVFPNCKINLGLHVTAKRPDGFHNIETVFYPVNWCDALEVVMSKSSGEPFVFSQSGIPVDGSPEQNLICKAWKMIASQKQLPPLKVHLHKNLPMGAGLGGGSSDAAHFINLLNKQFDLGYSDAEKQDLASQLGSDCAFFIHNQPVYAVGRGNEFSGIQVDLSRYFILVIYPGIHSNTREAYEGLTPQTPANSLKEVLARPVTDWRHLLVNDFERSIFTKYPEIKRLKDQLYVAGALYSSLSGSGSAVFGIFEQEPELDIPAAFKSYLQKPGSKIL